MPRVSVVMAVHNGMAFLESAVGSVLSQTFADFEFIVVEDGSDDGSAEFLAGLTDPRVTVLVNETNLGLTRSLNRALGVAQGEFIARIDADDLCHPDRLARQVAALDAAPGLVATATGHRMIDDTGRVIRVADRGLDDWQIRWLLGFNPPAPHPTYCFRRVGPDGAPVLYDETFRTAQDYDLWSRLSDMGETRVLEGALLDYRRHSGAITRTRRAEQARNCAVIGRRNLAARYPGDVLTALEPLVALFACEIEADGPSVTAARQGADAMLAHDLDTAPGPEHRRWLKRMTAALLAEAVLSRGRGLRRPGVVLKFLAEAKGYLPALVAKVAEDPGLALKSLRGARKS